MIIAFLMVTGGTIFAYRVCASPGGTISPNQAEASDMNGDGQVTIEDFYFIISAWHGLAIPTLPSTSTPTPTITETPTQTPTATETPTPWVDFEGFWVGDFTEYFSDPANHPKHRQGQILWYLQDNGGHVTGTGDDTRYPVTVDANVKFDVVLQGTFVSMTGFSFWAAYSSDTQSATGAATIEGSYWGSKDSINYDGEFLLAKTTARPTMEATATAVTTPTSTETGPTPTPTYTPYPYY